MEEIQVPTKDVCDSLRHALGEIEKATRQLVNQLKLEAKTKAGDNAGEAIAQAMLAVRHIEDAKMRIGKVLQYGVQGGVPWGPSVG